MAITDFEVDRAWAAFENALRLTRDPKGALRMALVDFEARLLPSERQRVSSEKRGRPLFTRFGVMLEAVCSALETDPDRVCSFSRADSAEATARGVIVGIFVDARMSTRAIAEGIGMSGSVVNHCRLLRRSHPEWEPMILKYRQLLKAGSKKPEAAQISD